ncbi:MAG: TonB-dependent receptor plug domain-containing protein [Bacteroidetes bacterium]|nr:TonB-dependent receptor plug domain-containing protein [Bacteroidota bacterium]
MMKRTLFLAALPFMAFAQTDSTSVDSIQSKTIIKEEVIVSATRAGENSPTTFQVLSKEVLNKNNLGQDLPILLDMTPSAVTTSDAGTGIGYTGIRIRGSDATRVNVTLNGIPVNDGESQGVYWVDLPDVVSSAQSIQIQRGVGTSTNGPGAFGGTVSLQTQNPSANPFGEVNLSGGSFQTIRLNAKAGTGMIKKRFFVEAPVMDCIQWLH